MNDRSPNFYIYTGLAIAFLVTLFVSFIFNVNFNKEGEKTDYIEAMLENARRLCAHENKYLVSFDYNNEGIIKFECGQEQNEK